MFLVSVGLCPGFPRSSSLVLPLLSGTGFSAYLLSSNTESCDEDDYVGVGVVEDVDKPGHASVSQVFPIIFPLLSLHRYFLNA